MSAAGSGGLNYWESLGRFVEAYAEVEHATAGLLWSVAKVKTPIARAIFSDKRAKDALALTGRILDATKAKDDFKEEVQMLSTQLGHITGARNLILHYETRRDAKGNPFMISNRRVAIDKKRLQERPISPEILADMHADLEKITGHLLRLLFRSEKASREEIGMVERAYAEEIRATWRYTPPQPPPNPQQPRAKSPKQPRQRPPSRA